MTRTHLLYYQNRIIIYSKSVGECSQPPYLNIFSQPHIQKKLKVLIADSPCQLFIVYKFKDVLITRDVSSESLNTII